MCDPYNTSVERMSLAGYGDDFWDGSVDFPGGKVNNMMGNLPKKSNLRGEG